MGLEPGKPLGFTRRIPIPRSTLGQGQKVAGVLLINALTFIMLNQLFQRIFAQGFEQGEARLTESARYRPKQALGEQ